MAKLESYSAIMSAFGESEAGVSLKNTYRWSTFRGRESNQFWEWMLGVTANDFKHGKLMYGIAISFLHLEPGRFSSARQETFLFGILCHDWGEAIIDGKGVGDVSAQIKTDKVERKESIIARRVIRSLSLPSDIKKKLLNGYEQVVDGKDEELHLAFKALEKMEYFVTALKVFQRCKQLHAKGGAGIEQELPFVGRVLVYDLSKILDVYVPGYPSIGAYLQNISGLVDEMFEFTLPWLNSTTSWMDKPVDHAKLARDFKQKWDAFKNLS